MLPSSASGVWIAVRITVTIIRSIRGSSTKVRFFVLSGMGRHFPVTPQMGWDFTEVGSHFTGPVADLAQLRAMLGG